MINNRSKMRRTQTTAKKWLEKNNYKVWFLHHTKYQLDIWGLWDGFAMDREGHISFLQVKSNRWPSMEPYKQFKQNYPHTKVMLINVKDGHRGKKKEVKIRVL